MVAPVILSVIAFIAGHPVQVSCDPALGGHATSAGEVGWTAYGGEVIYVVPMVCDDSGRALEDPRFAFALATLIHEAAHARGIRSESCAELTADIGIYQALRDFYDVPFFTPTSQQIGATVLAQTRARPPTYQPEACWSSGTYG